MKTERALARLASNHLDEVALAELYRNDKEKIDGIVSQWFGKGTIATDALSRVLVRIAKNAVHFCLQFHKPEDFILGHAIQECQRLYSLRAHRDCAKKSVKKPLLQPSDPVWHGRQRQSGDRTSRIFRANASIAKGF